MPTIKNIHSLPVSRLSFMILTEELDIKDKNKVYSEIKRRLSAGSYLNAFMEYEEDAIRKRGKDINKYLIQDKPNAQLLMYLYFTEVFKQEASQHGNLLFSENMICNSGEQNGFFTKFIRNELNNIRERISIANKSKEDVNLLELAYKLLENRYNQKQPIWYEDSLTDCVMDTVVTSSSLMSIEKTEKLKERADNGSKFAIVQAILYGMVADIELLDYLNMRHVAKKDLIRLYKQKKHILSTLETPINYSFLSDEKVLKRIKS